MTAAHPKLFTVDVFYPKSRSTAADYLRQIASMLDSDAPPYNAAIEKIVVELNSDRNSPMADVTIRMSMRNALGEDYSNAQADPEGGSETRADSDPAA